MAVIGQYLPSPEAGWKRVDDNQSSIIYKGVWTQENIKEMYNQTQHNTQTIGSSVEFIFEGTKLRIISSLFNVSSAKISIFIDGIDEGSFSQVGNKMRMGLSYEKINLERGKHLVKLVNNTTGVLSLDAIDIDLDGRILHPDEVTDVRDLKVGKRIRCHYEANRGIVGSFSGLGEEVSDFIPANSSATPNGDFYFIMVEDWNGKMRLAADRNIQQTISWETINAEGLVLGRDVERLSYTANIIPKMTSNTMPTGEKASASSSYSTTPPYLAFDHVNTNESLTPWISNGVPTGWLEFEFASSKRVEAYSLMGQMTGGQDTPTSEILNRTPKNWTFEAFDDSEGNWIVLDRRSNETSWRVGERRFYTISNNNSYKRYRINISSNNGSGYTAIGEMEMMEFKGDVKAHIRLLTGGISSTDKDNDWDKYIVNSTLNGTITAGDNNVWNWSLISWTSTTTYNVPASRVLRGYYASNGYYTGGTSGTTGGYPSSSSDATVGFRPMLIVESTLSVKSFILSNGEYKKFVAGIPSTPLEYSTKNAIPVMASNNTPSGEVSASSTHSSANSFLAFNNNHADGTQAWVTNGTTNGWLAYRFTEFKTIAKYVLYPQMNLPARAPKDWTFEGSNNGDTWVVLDTQQNQTDWINRAGKEFYTTNTTSYMMYRINVSQVNGDPNYLSLSGLEMYELLSMPTEGTPPRWQTISTTLPPVETFMSEGMNPDDFSAFDRSVMKFEQEFEGGSALGVGKVYKSTIDLKKFKDIRNIELK